MVPRSPKVRFLCLRFVFVFKSTLTFITSNNSVIRVKIGVFVSKTQLDEHDQANTTLQLTVTVMHLYCGTL